MGHSLLPLLSRAFFFLLPVCAFSQSTVQIDAAKTEFFEKNVRPVFVRNCQMCHNSKTKTGGIDLATGAGLDDASRLVRAVGYEGAVKMPPSGKLRQEDIANLTEWVKLGAPWPGGAVNKTSTAGFNEEQKRFWAFQPLRKVDPPAGEDLHWVRTEIDRFIAARLQENHLKPASPADKLTLLRRATFDLTGLPPTLEDIQNFLSDKSPNAYEKVVDRLLSSPRYGERWGRHWLDVARYADSTGNDEDHRYPHAWRYRDYVIAAFNRDMPYNQFVREQIAGDLLAAADGSGINRQGIIATGFLALGAKAIAQQDKKKMLYDIYDEQVDVVSKAFLGLTMACARCHNHKFDPILTRDYYSFVNIFASTRDFEDADAHVSTLLSIPLVPKEQYAAYKAQQDKLNGMKLEISEIADENAESYIRDQSNHLAEYMIAARKVYEGAQPEDPGALAKPLLDKWIVYLKEGGKAHPQLAGWDNASPEKQAEVAQAYQDRFQKQLADWTKRIERWRQQVRDRLTAMDMPPPPKPVFEAATDLFFYEVEFERGPFAMLPRERDLILSQETKDKMAALNKELAELQAHAMPEPDLACAVTEGHRVDQKIFIRGDYNNPGDDAPKAFPTILAKPTDPEFHSISGRLELANWIARGDNPLTARVIVNRIWGWHFGDGIVRTPDNFGKMGDRPSHPELLDYLAAKFIESGWSVKALNRMIMLSSVYQTASDADEKTMSADPENRLLAHFNRQRLDVEEIRDGLLDIGGEIDLTMGGTLQKGVGTDSENSSDRLSVDPTKLRRRTVYLPLRRANLPTLLNLFDFGDASSVNGKRSLTNVAPQTLFVMNSEFGFQQARRVAENLMALPEDSQRVAAAYLRILNRKPEPGETDSALTYVEQFAKKYPGDNATLNAWTSFCHILMASNEFVYID